MSESAEGDAELREMCAIDGDWGGTPWGESILRLLDRAVTAESTVKRVRSLAANCARKSAEDREAVEAGGLTVSEIMGRSRRADNYDLVVDGLRRALAEPSIRPEATGVDQ